MSGVKDGGPAYPVICEEWPNQPGMTLRDWFAGQALAGLLASGGKYSKGFECKGAEECYAQADAMLAEREKGGGK
jgi:hypothetical protein